MRPCRRPSRAGSRDPRPLGLEDLGQSRHLDAQEGGAPMVEAGHFALVLAFALALVQSVLPLIGALRNDERLMAVGGPVAVTGFAFTAIAFAVLVAAYVSSDFSVANVWENS